MLSAEINNFNEIHDTSFARCLPNYDLENIIKSAP